MLYTKAIENTRIKFFLGIWVLLPVFSFAQLSVSQNNSATSLAQLIAGSGVTISNATINCGSNAAGTFLYSGSNLGLTSGIILTTGKAIDATNPGTHLCNINNGNNFNDPDLTSVVSNANLDVCILEFDFVPTCNSLNMTYVFGSEEYPQGVGQYNDGFGIFLTGSNPAGGNYTAQNIATLPNTSPVSINNVNASTNSAYFHNNYSSPNNDIAYNGYTIPVTSVTSVVPCSTYKMKIAIADGGNALYDSGVLISGNGVSCQIPGTITTSSSPTGPCQNTGSAAVSVTNFTGTTTYQWAPGGQTTANVNNLGAGSYTCVVSLHQACGIITQSVIVTVSSNGSAIALTSAQQNITCNGGSNGTATVNVTGGTAPYSYSWNTTPMQTGSSANNLPAGVHTATVIDNAGCQGSIQVSITSPPSMQLNFSTTAATCNGATGSASVNVAANGTSPYTYSWNTNPIQTTQAITNLTHGNYTVTITDGNSCSVTGIATIATQNPTWNLSVATPTNVSCFGGNNGAVAVNIGNPGSSTFTYSWTTSPTQTSPIVSNLNVGNYSCTVTDNNGCVVSIGVGVSQPALLTATLTSSPTICQGNVGSVNASAIGGTAPYSYLWSNSQNTNSVQGLAPGQYSVTITDAHSCSTSATVPVSTVNPVLQISSAVVNSVCSGPTGAINISSVQNGTAPFSYAWATGQTSQSISNLSPGIYDVAVTDNNGCTGNTSVAVNVISTLPVTVHALPDYCNRGVGSAIAIPHGNPPYNYLWNSPQPQTTQTANNLTGGNYLVIVTDAYNCKDTLAITVPNQNDLFTSVFSTQPAGDLFPEDPINISISTNGGWAFANGVLSDGTSISSLNFDHIFTQQGDYSAMYYFTSMHGCKDSVTYLIQIKDEMALYIPNSFTPNHNGMNDEFKAEGSLIQTFEMYIYDRWGNLIIKLEDLSKSWDGKYKGRDAEAGVYLYKGNASNEKGQQKDFEGQINLIR